MLRERGVDASLYDASAKRAYDVVVFQKAYSPDDLVNATRLRNAGVRVIFDLCDNHWHRTNLDPKHAERVGRLDRMVGLADLVTTSTPDLAQLVPAETLVVDDALDPVATTTLARLRRVNPRRAAGSLMWFGNAGSTDPRYGLIDLLDLMPTLNDVGATWRISLTIVSDASHPLVRQIKAAARTVQVSTARWRFHTFGAIASSHDICLLPAESNPFTIAKTSNRAVTALRCDLAVIASDLPSYRRLDEYVRIVDWEQNLTRYLDHPELVRADAARGHIGVEERFGPSVIADQWVRALTTAMETHR